LPDVELEQALEYHDKLITKRAKATSDVYKYTEQRKIAFSIALINASDLKMTQPMKEAVANSNEDVVNYTEKIAKAKEEESLLTGKINNLEHKLRLFQTLSANERREKGFYQQNGG
tara:strand:+ start:1005 stop:1352 length:348 start_codon:yes stop_codon:yes gene_type:complete